MFCNKLYLAIFLIVILSSCSGEKSAPEYLAAAQSHHSSGNFRTALIEGRNAVRLEQENAVARALVGELEILVGSASNSEKELLSAVDLGTPESDVAHLLSQAYLLQGKHEELVALSTSDLNPEHRAEVLSNQAESYFYTGNIAQADLLAQQALESDSDSPIALTTNARLNAAKGDFPRSRESLKKALAASENHSNAWELLGDVDRAEKKLEDAVSSYTKAIEHRYKKLPVLLKRAQTNLQLGNEDATRADLDLIKGPASKLPAIALMKSEMLFKEGNLLDAQTVLEEGLQNSPDSPALARSLAVTHLMLGNLGLAEQYGKQYQTAIYSDDALVLQSAIRLEQGRAEQAEQTLQALLEANRLDGLGSRILVTSFLKQGKVDDAITAMIDFYTRLTLSNIETMPDLALLSPPAAVMFDEILNIAVQANEDNDATEEFLSAEQHALVDVVTALVSGDSESAKAEIARLSTINPQHIAIDNLKGRVHLSQNNFEAARVSFQKSVESEGSLTSSVLFLSLLDVNDEGTDSARERLTKELDYADGMLRERVLLTLANIEGVAGNTVAMVDWLQQAKNENKGAYFPSLALATHYFQINEPQRVLDTLSSLTNIGKSNPQSVRLMARAHLALEQFDEAKNLLNPFVSYSPSEPEWRYLRAGAFAGLGQTESLQSDLDAALRANPDHVPSLIAKTNLDIQNNRLGVAENQVARLDSMIPDSSTLSGIKERLEKQSSFNDSDAANVTPDASQEVIVAAKELWSQDRRDDAIDLMRDWIEKHPADVAVMLTLGNTYATLERSKDSIEQFNAVLSIEPKNYIALNNLAWQMRDQDPSAAIRHATDALEQAPDSISTLDTLAIIHYGQGNLEDAIKTFRKIQLLGTSNPTILFHGAQIEAALGNKQAARDLLESLLNEGTGFPEAEDAKGLLKSL